MNENCRKQARLLAVCAGALAGVAAIPSDAGVSVTGAPLCVAYYATGVAVVGTTSFDIVGGMWVSNATVGGAATGFTPAGLAFSTPTVEMRVGRNIVVVYGTNVSGGVSSSGASIWRHAADGGGQQAGSVYARRLPGTLAGWGANASGQTNCPRGSNYTAVAAGSYHSLAVRSDGTLIAWGNNSDGQTNCPRGSNYVGVAGGAVHSLALRSDGMIVGWGQNDYGQTNSPPGSTYVAVACGWYHSLGLKTDGTIVGWGENAASQTNCPPGSNYVAIAAGGRFSLALCNNGAIVGWGQNVVGQTNCPVGTGFVAIAAGERHGLAVQADGSLVGWGGGGSGQTNCPPGTSFIAVAAGDSHSLALRDDGTISGWGSDISHQVDCPSGMIHVAVAGGGSHSLAIRYTPFVDITNAPFVVPFATTTTAIAGTNSPLPDTICSIVGTMGWSNESNGAHGAMPASDCQFQVAGIPLNVGTNLIAAWGTNALGGRGMDRSVVTRGLPDEIVLLAPPDTFTTNTPAVSMSVFFGTSVSQRFLMTNGTPVFDHATAFVYTNTIVFPANGTYYWTALGYDKDFNERLAGQTNELTIAGAVIPHVRLISPQDGVVLTNTFACDLIAGFDAAGEARQLSTNGGVSWFDYSPLGRIAFPAVGTYQWTARGRHAGAWWYAPETNALTLSTNYGGARALFLVSPADGSIVTNSSVTFRTVVYGLPFDYTGISTDGAAYVNATFPTSLAMASGMHSWCARGSVTPGPVHTYAPSTNTFTVIDPAASSVTLVAPVDGASLAQDYVFLDVLCCNVGGTQLSTNNGMDWVAYASPLEVPKGHVRWTARGTNGAGDWVYAAATNSLHMFEPWISITSSLRTVSYAIALCSVTGTNNTHVVGGLQWSNALNDASGSLPVSSSEFHISGIPLAVGSNTITVYGTNAWGMQASDSATVCRKTLAESLPRIATNALVFPSADSVLNATLATDIVWWVDGITDDANDTNLTIAQMGVLVRDDSSEVAVASADISNVLGQISWTVPSSLIGGGTTYVLRFDVVDSDSLTGSVVFVDNPFTVVPEPTSLGVLAVVAILGFRKSNARPA